MRWFIRHWLALVVHLAGGLPLLWLLYSYSSAGESYLFGHTVMLRTGLLGLIFLVAALACTPVGWLFHWARLVQARRALGLYGFLYIVLHLLTYATLDSQFDLALIWRDLRERRAMSVGLIAFGLLIPLAITSTRGWQRRLGKQWRALHRLVYLATPLSVLHFLWLDRDFITEPLVYAGIVGVLLVIRLPGLRYLLLRSKT